MNKKGVIICDEHIRFVSKEQDPGASYRKIVNIFEVDHQNSYHKMRFYKMIDYQDQYEDHLMCGLIGIGPVYRYTVSTKIKYIPLISLKEQRRRKLKKLKFKSFFKFW